MLSARIDRLAAAHPSFRKYAGERIELFFGTSLHANIWACLTAGIAAGILANSPNDVIRVMSFAVLLIVWLFSSLLAGFMKQYPFIFFTAVYYILPQVIIINGEPGTGTGMRETQYFVSDIASAVWVSPFTAVITELDFSTVGYIFFGIYLLIFFLGARLRSSAKHSELYCRTRLEQLQ